MVIDLATYRRKKLHAHWTAAEEEEQELVCVNWGPVQILDMKAIAAIAALASPALPDDDQDLAAFQALAYALATQV